MLNNKGINVREKRIFGRGSITFATDEFIIKREHFITNVIKEYKKSRNRENQFFKGNADKNN